MAETLGAKPSAVRARGNKKDAQAQAVWRALKKLDERLASLRFKAPVTHVYRPSEYAQLPYRAYVERFASSPQKGVVLVGMNPGPWGMVQTGVPFGEVSVVRDWLGLPPPTGTPDAPHPARPVLGHACRRSEVSGKRLWGWARESFGTPERFFKKFFVYNWCPIAFMEASGKNRTPNQLPAGERTPLEDACDEALRAVVLALGAPLAVGIGDYAHKRLVRALKDTTVRTGQILHPSPASPMANRGWAPQACAQLAALGVALPQN